jgi:NodT family efflux transporter outer membrane factor (OMF) lipoprotein
MKARQILAGIAAGIGIALLAGCAVGPDFLRPSAPDAKGYTPDPLPAATERSDVQGGAAQRFVQDQDIPGQWWTMFHSAQLNTLIDEALKANPDVAAAQASLRQAKETVDAEKGALFPSVDANVSVEREKASGAGLGLVGLSSLFSVSTASLVISYPLDIFGGTRRQIESLAAQAEYERFQLEATYLTLTANVVTTAVQEASLRGQIAATADIVHDESVQLDVLQQQFNLGGVAKAAVLAQAATLAQARATLPPLQKQLAQARNQLAALAGRLTSDEPSQQFDLATLQLPQDLPVSLPSKLVSQRPDVRAAEAQLHAASAQVGVATANMLPQITLSAEYGSTASPPGNLFSPGTGIWSIGAGLAQPLFHGGELLHQKRAAVAAFDKAAAQYRSTVLGAFQNVADALRALESDATALNAELASERAAADSLDLARQQFRAGAISYLSLLDAERTYQQARVSLVQAQANRYADTAALFQALGGGWWNRTDVAGKDESAAEGGQR